MVRTLSTLFVILSLLAVLSYAGFRLADPGDRAAIRTSLSVSEVMAGSPDSGFARAFEPRPFTFPADHGPHPGYRTEWWYITGNLEGPEGERYGFQFTVFRNALDPQPPVSGSSWATNQVYMGHLALTDVASRKFRAFERFSRGAEGLAGSRAQPFRVWLEDWSLEGQLQEDDIFPVRLMASQDGTGIALTLRPKKPLVLQGDQGLSQKGPEPGNASYYYSYTRLEASGAVEVDGREVPVQGTAWLDREWSTSALSGGQVGWDWFALHLSDGRDLMYYQLRKADGTPDPQSKGILVDEEGRTRLLESEMVELDVLGSWTSPRDGTVYPSRWRLAVPTEGIDLEVTPLLPDQELNLTFRYWEGAVRVRGTAGGVPLEGRGYVELTGYDEDREKIRFQR